MKLGVIGVAAVLLAGCGSAADVSHAQSDVVDACQNSVKRMLKDPDSAQFNGWTASVGNGSPSGLAYSPSSGDVYYIAHGMVNAKNGFGGYDGDQPYSCDAVVTSDTVRAQAHTG